MQDTHHGCLNSHPNSIPIRNDLKQTVEHGAKNNPAPAPVYPLLKNPRLLEDVTTFAANVEKFL